MHMWDKNLNVSRCIQPFLSIFTAELLAIRDGLLCCLSQENGNITIASESRSCIYSPLPGTVITKNSHYQEQSLPRTVITRNSHSDPIVQEIQLLIIEARKNVTLCLVPSHTGVPLNERADVSARGATEENVADIAVPISDMKIKIKSEVKHSWQNEWQNKTNNKLRTVKAVIEPYKYS